MAARRVLARAAEFASSPDALPKRPPRLLLVEDEPPLRALVAKHFRRKGYLVEDAGTAEEVLLAGALVDVYARRPELDCLLLDINLPGLSGVSLARTVHTAWPGTAIVFITGDASSLPTEPETGKALGPVVTKPFDLTELETVVGRAISGPIG